MSGFFLIIFLVVFYALMFGRTSQRNSNLSNKYSSQLKLNRKESKHIRRAVTNSNNDPFHRIDFCMDEAIKMYLEIIRDKKFNEDELKLFFDYCKNFVKKRYNVYYKTESETPTPEVIAELELFHNYSLLNLTEKQEKQLYAKDASRWVRVLDKVEAEYKKGKEQQVYDEILKIANVNGTRKKKVYYRGYKFMILKNKALALKIYLHYLHTDMDKHKYRAIGKNDGKILFGNIKQEQKFTSIHQKLLKNNDLTKALDSVDELYFIKRRSIILDKVAITEARNEHNDVTNILGQYLSDDDVDYNHNKTEEAVSIEVSVVDSKETPHSELLKIFSDNNLQINSQDLSSFANQKGIFKNQLIDSINEQYYELLDDVLIEENEGAYIIDKEYFRIVMEQRNNNEK